MKNDCCQEPRWEHGYRCHGFWSGTKRIARVSLPPRGFPVRYRWEAAGVEGEAATLRTAKRQAERALASRSTG